MAEETKNKQNPGVNTPNNSGAKAPPNQNKPQGNQGNPDARAPGGKNTPSSGNSANSDPAKGNGGSVESSMPKLELNDKKAAMVGARPKSAIERGAPKFEADVMQHEDWSEADFDFDGLMPFIPGMVNAAGSTVNSPDDNEDSIDEINKKSKRRAKKEAKKAARQAKRDSVFDDTIIDPYANPKNNNGIDITEEAYYEWIGADGKMIDVDKESEKALLEAYEADKEEKKRIKEGRIIKAPAKDGYRTYDVIDENGDVKTVYLSPKANEDEVEKAGPLHQWTPNETEAVITGDPGEAEAKELLAAHKNRKASGAETVSQTDGTETASETEQTEDYGADPGIAEAAALLAFYEASKAERRARKSGALPETADDADDGANEEAVELGADPGIAEAAALLAFYEENKAQRKAMKSAKRKAEPVEYKSEPASKTEETKAETEKAETEENNGEKKVIDPWSQPAKSASKTEETKAETEKAETEENNGEKKVIDPWSQPAKSASKTEETKAEAEKAETEENNGEKKVIDPWSQPAKPASKPIESKKETDITETEALDSEETPRDPWSQPAKPASKPVETKKEIDITETEALDSEETPRDPWSQPANTAKAKQKRPIEVDISEPEYKEEEKPIDLEQEELNDLIDFYVQDLKDKEARKNKSKKTPVLFVPVAAPKEEKSEEEPLKIDTSEPEYKKETPASSDTADEREAELISFYEADKAERRAKKENKPIAPTQANKPANERRPLEIDVSEPEYKEEENYADSKEDKKEALARFYEADKAERLARKKNEKQRPEPETWTAGKKQPLEMDVSEPQYKETAEPEDQEAQKLDDLIDFYVQDLKDKEARKAAKKDQGRAPVAYSKPVKTEIKDYDITEKYPISETDTDEVKYATGISVGAAEKLPDESYDISYNAGDIRVGAAEKLPDEYYDISYDGKGMYVSAYEKSLDKSDPENLWLKNANLNNINSGALNISETEKLGDEYIPVAEDVYLPTAQPYTAPKNRVIPTVVPDLDGAEDEDVTIVPIAVADKYGNEDTDAYDAYLAKKYSKNGKLQAYESVYNDGRSEAKAEPEEKIYYDVDGYDKPVSQTKGMSARDKRDIEALRAYDQLNARYMKEDAESDAYLAAYAAEYPEKVKETPAEQIYSDVGYYDPNLDSADPSSKSKKLTKAERDAEALRAYDKLNARYMKEDAESDAYLAAYAAEHPEKVKETPAEQIYSDVGYYDPNLDSADPSSKSKKLTKAERDAAALAAYDQLNVSKLSNDAERDAYLATYAAEHPEKIKVKETPREPIYNDIDAYVSAQESAAVISTAGMTESEKRDAAAVASYDKYNSKKAEKSERKIALDEAYRDEQAALKAEKADAKEAKAEKKTAEPVYYDASANPYAVEANKERLAKAKADTSADTTEYQDPILEPSPVAETVQNTDADAAVNEPIAKETEAKETAAVSSTDGMTRREKRETSAVASYDKYNSKKADKYERDIALGETYYADYLARKEEKADVKKAKAEKKTAVPVYYDASANPYAVEANKARLAKAKADTTADKAEKKTAAPVYYDASANPYAVEANKARLAKAKADTTADTTEYQDPIIETEETAAKETEAKETAAVSTAGSKDLREEREAYAVASYDKYNSKKTEKRERKIALNEAYRDEKAASKPEKADVKEAKAEKKTAAPVYYDASANPYAVEANKARLAKAKADTTADTTEYQDPILETEETAAKETEAKETAVSRADGMTRREKREASAVASYDKYNSKKADKYEKDIALGEVYYADYTARKAEKADEKAAKAEKKAVRTPVYYDASANPYAVEANKARLAKTNAGISADKTEYTNSSLEPSAASEAGQNPYIIDYDAERAKRAKYRAARKAALEKERAERGLDDSYYGVAEHKPVKKYEVNSKPVSDSSAKNDALTSDYSSLDERSVRERAEREAVAVIYGTKRAKLTAKNINNEEKTEPEVSVRSDRSELRAIDRPAELRDTLHPEYDRFNNAKLVKKEEREALEALYEADSAARREAKAAESTKRMESGSYVSSPIYYDVKDYGNRGASKQGSELAPDKSGELLSDGAKARAEREAIAVINGTKNAKPGANPKYTNVSKYNSNTSDDPAVTKQEEKDALIALYEADKADRAAKKAENKNGTRLYDPSSARNIKRKAVAASLVSYYSNGSKPKTDDPKSADIAPINNEVYDEATKSVIEVEPTPIVEREATPAEKRVEALDRHNELIKTYEDYKASKNKTRTVDIYPDPDVPVDNDSLLKTAGAPIHPGDFDPGLTPTVVDPGYRRTKREDIMLAKLASKGGKKLRSKNRFDLETMELAQEYTEKGMLDIADDKILLKDAKLAKEEEKDKAAVKVYEESFKKDELLSFAQHYAIKDRTNKRRLKRAKKAGKFGVDFGSAFDPEFDGDFNNYGVPSFDPFTSDIKLTTARRKTTKREKLGHLDSKRLSSLSQSQRKLDRDMVEARIEYERMMLELELAKENRKFSGDYSTKKEKRQRKDWTKKLKRLKKQLKPALKYEEIDNERYYSVVATKFDSVQLPPKADRDELLAMRDELMRLLDVRDEINTKLLDLYTGSENGMRKGGSIKGRCKAELKAYKKAHRKYKKLYKHLTRRPVTRNEKMRIFDKMDEVVELSGNLAKVKFILKKERPQGRIARKYAKEKRANKREIKILKKVVERMSLKALKRAKKRAARWRAMAISYAILAILAVAAVVFIFEGQNIINALMPTLQGFLPQPVIDAIQAYIAQ